jgi:hypothetical protein
MAYDIIILVRKECKNINPSKKSGSSSARVRILQIDNKECITTILTTGH